LLGREKGSYRIVDEIQRQPAARLAVTESIEEAKRLDRFLKNALASLRVGLAGAVRGQRRDNFHTMPGEELAQIGLRWEQQHGEVAPIQHMATEGTSLLDEPAKVRVQFRCPTREIDRGNIGLSESLDALLSRFSGHAFASVRSRIDMTVPTGLIAEFADIDLKDRDPGGAKRKQTDLIEVRLEGGAARCSPENLQLLRRGGEGVMLSQ